MATIGPMLPRKQLARARPRQFSFKDHSDQPATFVCYTEATLPPLYGFSFYFTHIGTEPSKVDAEALIDGLYKQSTYYPESSACPIHLKLYYLPGADDEACIAHYRKEKDALGDIETQISAARKILQSDNPGLVEGGGRLPGFVKSYAERPELGSRFCYQNILFRVPGDRVWEGGSVRYVQFDIGDPREEYLEYLEEDEAEFDEVWVREIGIDTDEFGMVTSLGFELAEVAMLNSTNLETDEIWEKAEDLGWTSWPAACSG